MKSFLIIAGVLMTGASVYGVVDYNTKINTPAFKEMYKEEPKKDAEIVADKTSAVLPNENKELKVADNKAITKKGVVKKASELKTIKKKKNRSFKMSEFSRGPLDEKYLEKSFKLPPMEKN